MASKTKENDGIIRGAAIKPVTEGVRLYANKQFNDLLNLSLTQVLAHQMRKPGSEMNRLYNARSVRARIYDPESVLPPIPEPHPRGVPMKLYDLKDEHQQLMRAVFQGYDDIMAARKDNDEQGAWTARTEVNALRKEVDMMIMRGEFPKSVNVFIDIAEKVSAASNKIGWRALLDKRDAGSNPKGPGGRGGA